MSTETREDYRTTIHVFDGQQGRDMWVEATNEGLEFEDGSIITWEWIEYVQHYCIPRSPRK